MRTPLTIGGHLDRAALVYGDRIGVVDEPDAPGGGLGALTYRSVQALARGQAAALDERGIGRGERVAILSQNAGRLLTPLPRSGTSSSTPARRCCSSTLSSPTPSPTSR